MKQINSRHFYSVIAAATFFLLITAQVFWSTIHGDGAVYAWLIREISQTGLSRLPQWDQVNFFAEHPYLFFYFSSLFTAFLGFSDLAVKIPNYIVAALSIYTVYRLCALRRPQLQAHYIGLIAGYALTANAIYIMQVSQPSLDPLAQLLALLAVSSLIFYRRAFIAGLLMGLAFLTKGLEMLPHLAALFCICAYLQKLSLKSLLRQFSVLSFGMLLPVLVWLGYDQALWNGQWLSLYWERQFTLRFFHQRNMQTVMQHGIIFTFLQLYAVEIIILIAGLLKSRLWPRKSDPLFIYFLFYVFFNILAFLIIKKDSSQHLTGILLLGSVFVAEYIWEVGTHLKPMLTRALPVIFFILALGYWGSYVARANKNPDIWTAIKKEAQNIAADERGLPIVTSSDSNEAYGVFYTAQWYFKPTPVYTAEYAENFLKNHEVLVLANQSGRLSKSRRTY